LSSSALTPVSTGFDENWANFLLGNDLLKTDNNPLNSLAKLVLAYLFANPSSSLASLSTSSPPGAGFDQKQILEVFEKIRVNNNEEKEQEKKKSKCTKRFKSSENPLADCLNVGASYFLSWVESKLDFLQSQK
jgi:hypothetical protein